MGQGREALYRRIGDRLDSAGEILDVGCGEGDLVAYLARRTRGRVVGLDISDAGFARAREEADRQAVGPLTQCLRGDAQEMTGLEDGRFGAVTLTFTLHHIDRKASALREIDRVLRPGGKVLVGDYVIVEGRPSTECHRLTASQVQEMLVEAGFVGIAVEMVGPDIALVEGVKPDIPRPARPPPGWSGDATKPCRLARMTSPPVQRPPAARPALFPQPEALGPIPGRGWPPRGAWRPEERDGHGAARCQG